jgi:endonuclease/exonuclease/phosphatase (EEP) superfamily protein YafD
MVEEQLAVLEAEMPYTVKCPWITIRYACLFKLPLQDQEISFNRRRYSINTSYNRIAFRDMVRHILHPAHQALLRILSPRDAEPIAVAKSVSKSDQPVIVAGDPMMLLGPRQLVKLVDY